MKKKLWLAKTRLNHGVRYVLVTSEGEIRLWKDAAGIYDFTRDVTYVYICGKEFEQMFPSLKLRLGHVREVEIVELEHGNGLVWVTK